MARNVPAGATLPPVAFPSRCARRFRLGLLLVLAAAFGAQAIPWAEGGDPSELWRWESEAWGTPAVDADRVYVLTRRHRVVALDKQTGRPLWMTATGNSSADAAGDSVRVAAEVVIAGDYDLVALSTLDGAPRWRFSPVEGYGPGYYLGGTTTNIVFAGSPAGRLYAVDSQTGALRWAARIGELQGPPTTVFAPVVDGDLVVAGFTVFSAANRGGLAAFDASTGQARWRVAFDAEPGLPSNAAGGPLVLGNVVVGTGGDGTIHAFNRASGAEEWQVPAVATVSGKVSGKTVPDFRALAAAHGVLIAGSLDGTVVAYDAATRHERWRRSDGEDGSVALAIGASGDIVYVPFFSGRLLALDIATGALRWSTEGKGKGFHWPPAIDQDSSYFASAGGLVVRRTISTMR